MNLISLFSLLSMVLLWTVPASAVTNLILSSPGGPTYVLSGQGVEGAAAVECTITYDGAMLGNPKVELGSLATGAMMAVNANTPGTIRIAIIRTSPMIGSGSIATIAFESKGGSNRLVNVVSAKMITLDGKPLPLAIQVLNTAEPTTPSSASVPVEDTVVQRGAAAGTGAVNQSQPGVQPIIGGGIAVQTKQEERQRTDEAREQKAPSVPQERKASADDPARLAKRADGAPQSASRKIYSQKSVLDRFREFRGKPAMKEYVALFQQEGMIGFRQDPAVVLADGKSTVRVSFISSTQTRTTSDIAVMGATLLSLKKDPDYTNTFILELQPVKGEVKASVSVPQDNVLMMFPLILAPKASLEAGKKKGEVLDEAAFNAFLSERGTPGNPKFDLNGDGKRDYVDDYIFTANYIAARGMKTAATGTGK